MSSRAASAETAPMPTAGWWNKLHQRHALLTDAGALFASNGANAALGFLFWAVAAHLYPTEAVGLGSALMSAMFLIGNVSRLGLDIALVRELPRLSSAERRRSAIAASLALVGLVALLAAVAFSLQSFAAAETSRALQRELSGMPIFVIACAGWGIGRVLDQVLIVLRRGHYVLARNLTFSFVRIAALPLALYMTGERLGVLSANTAGVVVGLAILAQPLRLNPARPLAVLRRGMEELRPPLLRYALGNQASALAAGLPNWILPLLVMERVDAGSAAYFYTAWMIAAVLNTGPAALASSFFAQGSRQGSPAPSLVRRTYSYALLVAVASAVVLCMTAGWVLRVFGDAYADNAVPLLRYLAAATIPYTLVQIQFSQLRLAGHLFRLGVSAFCLSTIAIVGSYALLQPLGLVGAGIAWLTACCLAVALNLSHAYRGGRSGAVSEKQG